MAEATTVNIDPKGDVLLGLSEEGRTLYLRVSSKILSVVSPVFAVMFSSRFAEGQRVAAAAPNIPVIPLPDDDVDAFTQFCYVSHFRVKDVPRRLTAACLEHFALLCDKYDCVSALALLARPWFDEAVKDCAFADLPSLLVASYLMDNAGAFADVTSQIIWEHAGPLDDYRDLRFPGSVTHDFVALLEAEMRRTHLLVVDAVEGVILQLLNCDTAATSVGAYFKELRRIALLPWAPLSCKTSLSDVRAKLKQFIDPRFSVCYDTKCKVCMDPCFSMSGRLHEALKERHNCVVGLCLDCVKTGRKSMADKECRLEHE